MEQRGGGRDLTGSPKLLDGKCWANKLLQVINMGHEAELLRICFQYFTNVLNIVSVTFSVLLIIDVVLSTSSPGPPWGRGWLFSISVSNTVVSAGTF